jgi:hypothetical protein
VPPECIDNHLVVCGSVHHAVFFINSAGPKAFFVAFQRLRLSNAVKRIASAFLYHAKYAQPYLSVFFKPFGKFIHRVVVE